MSRSHEGKVAAIFGASYGMGRASAVALARRGATIAASGRTPEALDEVVNEIRAAGGKAEAFPADVENPRQARAAVAEIADRFGRIDIFVYATGTNIPGRAVGVLSEDDWDMMQRTNISGLYHTVQGALDTLRKSKARVVVVSSAAVQMPDASGVAYQATKHAQVGFTHGLMQEEAANGIRTTVIFPRAHQHPAGRKAPRAHAVGGPGPGSAAGGRGGRGRVRDFAFPQSLRSRATVVPGGHPAALAELLTGIACRLT